MKFVYDDGGREAAANGLNGDVFAGGGQTECYSAKPPTFKEDR